MARASAKGMLAFLLSVFCQSPISVVLLPIVATGFSPLVVPTSSTCDFSAQVLHWLGQEESVRWSDVEDDSFDTLQLAATKNHPACRLLQLQNSQDEHPRFLLHLLPSPKETALPARFTRSMTEQKTLPIIHLHEDVWRTKREIVQARLLSRLGIKTRRIFARKTIVERIKAEQALPFLMEHHLWSAVRCKYYYGLKTKDGDELVAVAAFSSRRKIDRCGVNHRSHELVRFCSQRDSAVVGGITKLMRQFVRDQRPDDIVTVIDRDWGGDSTWPQFESVHIMPPLTMVIHKQNRTRHYLVGAGIQKSNDDAESKRLGLPGSVLEELDTIDNAERAQECLEKNGFIPVHDVGVERLWMIVEDSEASKNRANCSNVSIQTLWNGSTPSYASSYYSQNKGISALLAHAEHDVSTMSMASNHPSPDESLLPEDIVSLESWRRSGTKTPRWVLSVPSSLDPNASVQVNERLGGWHSLGIFGGPIKSIYHGIYQVQEDGTIDPTALGPCEYLRGMVSLCVCALGPDHSRFLHFGYGAGSLVRILSHHLPKSEHVAVELDRGVIAAAEKMNLLGPRQRLEAGDALQYQLSESEEPFDCVCIDIYDEENLIPEALYSVDFLQHLRDDILSESGFVIQNFQTGSPAREKPLQDAISAYRTVFSSCGIVESLSSRPTGGNTILIATKLPVGDISALQSAASRAQSQWGFHFDVLERVKRLQLFS